MGSESIRKPQILIAEDNPLIGQLMQMVVGKFWTTTIVDCGVSAVEAWRKGEFIAILMDLRMPVMDGFEAIKHIRADEKRFGRKHIPIIAFTALTNADTRRKCEEAGFDYVVSKPAKIKDVINIISTFTSQPESAPLGSKSA